MTPLGLVLLAGGLLVAPAWAQQKAPPVFTSEKKTDEVLKCKNAEYAYRCVTEPPAPMPVKLMPSLVEQSRCIGFARFGHVPWYCR